MRRDRSPRTRRPRGRALLGAFAAIVLSLLVALPGSAGFVLLPEPPLPAAESAPALDVRGAAPAPAGESRADRAPERASPLPAMGADTRTHAVHVRQLVGTAVRPYIGALTIVFDDAAPRAVTLRNSDPITLELPVRATSVRFEAPDHTPLQLPLPLPRTDHGVAKVDLVPSARVEFRVAGSAGATELLDVAFATGDGAVRSAGAIDWGSTALPFEVGVAFRWRAIADDGSRRWQWTGFAEPLRANEHRTIDVDSSTVGLRRYRLAGASSELAAVARVTRIGVAEGDCEELSFARGARDLVPWPAATWWCDGTALREDVRDGETWLCADGGLVAIGCLAADGSETSSRLFDAAGRDLRCAARLHVVARGAAPVLRLGSSFADSVEVRLAELPPNRDVVWVPTPASGRLGSVRFTFTGDAPPLAVRQRLVIAVTRPDGSWDSQPANVEGVVVPVTANRSVDVRWRIGGADGPWAARGVRVAPDGVVELQVEWPRTMLWRGRVDGHADLPGGQRWTRIAWGDVTPSRPLGAGYESLGGSGTFTLVLAAEQALPRVWTLFGVFGRVPAVAEACDAAAGEAAGELVVRPRGDVRWATPRVEVPPPWRLLVANIDLRPPGLLGSDREQRPVPLLAGEILHGAVLSDLADPRVVAWFRLDANDPTRPIRATGGRTLAVRSRVAATRHVTLVGPGGQIDLGRELRAGAQVSLLAPDGTRGIAVFDESRPNDPPVELPLPAGDVIVID